MHDVQSGFMNADIEKFNHGNQQPQCRQSTGKPYTGWVIRKKDSYFTPTPLVRSAELNIHLDQTPRKLVIFSAREMTRLVRGERHRASAAPVVEA
ncbi:hypothetical protein BaRGS_00007799 [Batillaria attramentaria]|uniref:Reverse transcriptase Ty1/copia-type domain-containing protein n=1 Tax=Batillaria attramentaria TaxID=370345 RepID=A0ABD0LPH1_9CAEN